VVNRSTGHRRNGNRGRLSYLHLAVKALGLIFLSVALIRDTGHAAIYVPAIAALAASHRVLVTKE
jgi:hypothetical protein